MQLEFDSILEAIKPAPKPKSEQLFFDFYNDSVLYWNSFTFNPELLTIRPSNTITFSHEHKICGSFSWEGGKFKFDGEAETSAKVFADYVGQFLGFKKQDLTT